MAPHGARADCPLAAGGTAPEKRIIYNKDHKVYQYCDGTIWRAMFGTGGGGGDSATSNVILSVGTKDGGTAASTSEVINTLEDGVLIFTGSITGSCNPPSMSLNWITVRLDIDGTTCTTSTDKYQANNAGTQVSATCVRELPAGTYAITAYHDKDSPCSRSSLKMDWTVIAESASAEGATLLSALNDTDVGGAADGSCLTFNSTAGKWEDGTCGGTPSGAVMAFDLASCPSGWSEYAPAYGRVVRGIDKSGSSIDPDGERLPGDVQDDELKSHLHSVNPPSTSTNSTGSHHHDFRTVDGSSGGSNSEAQRRKQCGRGVGPGHEECWQPQPHRQYRGLRFSVNRRYRNTRKKRRAALLPEKLTVLNLALHTHRSHRPFGRIVHRLGADRYARRGRAPMISTP